MNWWNAKTAITVDNCNENKKKTFELSNENSIWYLISIFRKSIQYAKITQ